MVVVSRLERLEAWAAPKPKKQRSIRKFAARTWSFATISFLDLTQELLCCCGRRGKRPGQRYKHWPSQITGSCSAEGRCKLSRGLPTVERCFVRWPCRGRPEGNMQSGMMCELCTYCLAQSLTPLDLLQLPPSAAPGKKGGKEVHNNLQDIGVTEQNYWASGTAADFSAVSSAAFLHLGNSRPRPKLNAGPEQHPGKLMSGTARKKAGLDLQNFEIT